MKARPILLSGEMARAILDGRKTQTRRVVKSDSEIHGKGTIEEWVKCLAAQMIQPPTPDQIAAKVNQLKGKIHPLIDSRGNMFSVRCPYGQIDDLLWVRETFCAFDESTPENTGEVFYRADGDERFIWKPSIFMPRSASRLTLEITDVRVERLRSISIEDCVAEGIAPCGEGWTNGLIGPFSDPRLAFADLWDSTSGDWQANPWVWVIEFKPIMANIDAVLRERAAA